MDTLLLDQITFEHIKDKKHPGPDGKITFMLASIPVCFHAECLVVQEYKVLCI